MPQLQHKLYDIFLKTKRYTLFLLTEVKCTFNISIIFLKKDRPILYVCTDFTPTNIACQVLSQIILHIIILIISHLSAFVIILKYDFTNFIVVHNYGLHLPQGLYPSFIASSRVQFK